MSFPYSFSANSQRARPSPIRELFALVNRPGIISFAGGLPDPRAFPVESFAACSEVLRDRGSSALQYGATEGAIDLVSQLRSRCEGLLGRPVGPESILVTTGSQQVMDLVGRALLDPGDVVVIEAPTYPGAIHTFRNLGARFCVVPCDRDGMRTELLAEAIAACVSATGLAPKLIYSIVNFSNPSGACLAERRRDELVEVAARYGVPILEDDPYGELRYDGEPIPPVFSRAEAGVLHAGSFSKILAPGVRLAWAVGDAEIIRRLVLLKQGTDLCTSTVDQLLVAEYCQRGELDRHLATMRVHYRGKRDAMAEALRRELPAAVDWTDPGGGFFFWLELGRDARAVFDLAVREGVAFLPGQAFFPAPEETVNAPVSGATFARLCFTFASVEEIAVGCQRFAAALRHAKR